VRTLVGSKQPADNDVVSNSWYRRDTREGDAAVIRDDRELLAELARLNSAMVSFALRIMEGSASGDEQRYYAQRLIVVGERLQLRADGMRGAVIDGEVVSGPVSLPAHTLELDWNRELRVGDTVSVI
jgi:hypothetical protein